jgi:DNA invertase Pin-like site-specific DNA recombinase
MRMTAMLGYARVSTIGQDLDAQLAALDAAGVDPSRVFTDKLSGSAKTARPGLVALLDYARPADTVVVAAIDRLGRSVAEVTRTIADLGERRITLHVLREGVDTATPTGRAIAAIMASLAELELELGRERAPHPENPVAPGICRPPNPRSSAQYGKNSCAGLL